MAEYTKHKVKIGGFVREIFNYGLWFAVFDIAVIFFFVLFNLFKIKFFLLVFVLYISNFLLFPLIHITFVLLKSYAQRANVIKGRKKIRPSEFIVKVVLSLLLLFIFVYATLIEPNNINVEEIEIYSNKVSDDLKILHFSDIQTD